MTNYKLVYILEKKKSMYILEKKPKGRVRYYLHRNLDRDYVSLRNLSLPLGIRVG